MKDKRHSTGTDATNTAAAPGQISTEAYRAAVKNLSAHTLWKEAEALNATQPALAAIARAELARRALPPEAPTPPPPAADGFSFSPPAASTGPGRSAIELWAGGRHAATIYANLGGIHLTCEPGWYAGDIEIQQRTHAIAIEIGSEEAK